MTLYDFVNPIILDINKWKYYNDAIDIPNLNSDESCNDFIYSFIQAAHKDCDYIKNGLRFLSNSELDKGRLRHIVDTYFLGLAFFHDNRLHFKELILSKLKEYKAFRNEKDSDIIKEFYFVWFMTTLFHDLGYQYEHDRSKEFNIDNFMKRRASKINSVPYLYTKVYRNYLKAFPNDHGICGGLEFYKNICQIRKRNTLNPQVSKP